MASTSTFKPRDVEELIDFYLSRRVAGLFVAMFARTPVTPNQVTLLSGIVALIAGWMMWTSTNATELLAGGFVFFLSMALDCADGQLARLRRESSLAGRAFDGWVDVVSTAGFFVGHLGWLLAHDVPLWVAFLVGWPAGFSLRWHAHTYDHVKNLYLKNTEAPSPGSVPAFPSLEDIEKERQLHEKNGNWLMELMCRTLAMLSRWQRHEGAKQAGLDQPGAETPKEREAYRNRFRVYMRLWTWNGIGTHFGLMLVASVLAIWWPVAPIWVWVVIAGPLNLYTVYLIRRGRRHEAEFARDLAELRKPA
jgi:hypothetical protein